MAVTFFKINIRAHFRLVFRLIMTNFKLLVFDTFANYKLVF